MLIGGLPEDSTPSPLGMVPYSEDGVHLNFITIESIMGYGGGDGGGGGGFTTIEFPDGSVGSYIEEETNVYDESGNGSDHAYRGMFYTGWQIHNFPDKFFSEYIHTAGDGDWIFADNAMQSEPSVKILDIDDIEYVDENNVNIVWKETEVDLGFNVTNNTYYDGIKQNFPYVLASGFETIANYTRNPASPVTGSEPYVSDVKIPVLYMLYSDRLKTICDEDYDDVGEVVAPTNTRRRKVYDPQNPDQPISYIDELSNVSETGLLINNYINGSDGALYYTDSGDKPIYNFRIPGVMFGFARTSSFFRDFNHYTCDYQGTQDDPPEEHLPRYTNRYSLGKALIDDDKGEYYNQNSDIPIHIQLWDRYCTYFNGTGHGPGGLFCHHIIDSEGSEWWVFNNGHNDENTRWNFAYFDDNQQLVPGGNSINPYLLGETPNPGFYVELNETATDPDYGVIFSNLQDAGYPSSSGDPYSVGDENHTLVFNSEDQAFAAAVAIVFGLKLETFVSTMLTTDHTLAQISPTKKKRLWDWERYASIPISEFESRYKDDGYYGGNELARYAAFSVSAPDIADRNIRQSVGNCMTFGITSYESQPYTLHNYVGSGGGGGDLPYISNGDEGKVLGVKFENDDYTWDKMTLPIKFGGHIDVSSGMNSWNDAEHGNFIALGKGIHADYYNVLNQQYFRLYSEPSEMELENYISVLAESNNGLIVTPSTSQGVTSYTVSVDDAFNRFIDVEALAGSGATFTKSYDPNTKKITLKVGLDVTLINLTAITVETDQTGSGYPYDNVPANSWTSLTNNMSSFPQMRPSGSSASTYINVDISVEFEGPSNAPAGSYARINLSADADSSNLLKTGSSSGNVSYGSNLYDTRLIIPGEDNILRISGIIGYTVTQSYYINFYHNVSGESIKIKRINVNITRLKNQ